MADPLTLLRQFNNSKKEINENDKLITFDAVSFLKTARTNYVICRTTPKEYYTLEALLFLLKNVHLSHPIYVQRAGAAKVPVVRFPDRKDLLAYLNGEKETTPSIDKSAPLELPVQRASTFSSKRPLAEGSAEGSKKARTDDGQARYDIQEWLALKLQDKKEGAVTTEKIRKEGKGGLNTVMSVEKIAEIKRKIITRKRGTIKGDDDQLQLESGMLEQAPAAPTSFTAIPDIETDVTKDIVMRERLLRTRTSVLQSSGKVFLKNVMAILQSIKAREEGKAGQQKQQQQQASKKDAPEVVVKKPAPAASYSRYDQERFGSQIDKGGFKIDTSATFHGLSLESVKEGKSQRHIGQSQHSKPRHISGMQKPSGLPQKRESKTPIIIVPAGTTSLITLLNCKDLLQDFKFLSPEEKKKLGTIKETEVLIQRKKDMTVNQQLQTVTVPIRVIDQPLKLQPNEWNRVVAVFVQGPLWQFKGWPNLSPDGSPVEILTKIKGFHIKFDDMKVDLNVKKWDVQLLTINRNRRHMDRACVLKFWEVLEKFMLKNKPNLRF